MGPWYCIDPSWVGHSDSRSGLMNMKIPPATWIEVDNNWHATLSAWRYDRLRGPIRQAWARENVGLWAPGHTPLNSTPPLVPAESGDPGDRHGLAAETGFPLCAVMGRGGSGCLNPA